MRGRNREGIIRSVKEGGGMRPSRGGIKGASRRRRRGVAKRTIIKEVAGVSTKTREALVNRAIKTNKP